MKLRILFLILSVILFLQISPAYTQNYIDCSATQIVQDNRVFDWIIQSPNMIAWHPGGEKFAVAGCFGVRMYSRELEFLNELPSMRDVQNLAWRPDGRLLAISTIDNTVIWDDEQSAIVRETIDTYLALAWHPSENLLATGSIITSTLRIWDVTQDKYVAEKSVNQTVIGAFAWDKDGKSLLFMADWEMYRWFPWENHIEPLKRLVYHVDGLWYTQAHNYFNQDQTEMLFMPLDDRLPFGMLGVWNLDTGDYALRQYRSDPMGGTITWSPNGQYIAMTTPDYLMIFDAVTLETLQAVRLRADSTLVRSMINQCPASQAKDMMGDSAMAWHPDSQHILVANACALMIIPVEPVPL